MPEFILINSSDSDQFDFEGSLNEWLSRPSTLVASVSTNRPIRRQLLNLIMAARDQGEFKFGFTLAVLDGLACLGALGEVALMLNRLSHTLSGEEDNSGDPENIARN